MLGIGRHHDQASLAILNRQPTRRFGIFLLEVFQQINWLDAVRFVRLVFHPEILGKCSTERRRLDLEFIDEDILDVFIFSPRSSRRELEFRVGNDIVDDQVFKFGLDLARYLLPNTERNRKRLREFNQSLLRERRE